MVSRIIKKQLLQDLKPQHVTGLFGARSTDKTFLMNEISAEVGNNKILFVQGDDLDVADILSSQRLSILKSFVKGYDITFGIMESGIFLLII